MLKGFTDNMQIKDKILQKLDHLEKEYHINIIYACESGSRAWGFPSEDSDYDMRFIYVHPKDWYLSISEKRDVIELPVDKLLDINGWDIRKTFALLRKSNCPLLEWLSSPIIYRANKTAVEPLRSLSKIAFLPESACHHYLSMAKKMTDKIEGSSRVHIKTYLYSLRPILCCRWIIEKRSHPPMLFHSLKEEYLPSEDIRKEIDRLLEQKSVSNEKDTIKRSQLLESFINKEILQIENNIPKNQKKTSIDLFDQAFIKTLEVVAL